MIKTKEYIFNCLRCPGSYKYLKYPDFEWTCPSCGSEAVHVIYIPDFGDE